MSDTMVQAPRILVVDDQAMIRDMLSQMLTFYCAAALLTLASDGIAALAMCGAQAFDLIITDFEMPVMNGVELIQALRSSGCTTPILMLSSEPAVEYHALQAGATAFLAKPFPLRVFRELLGRLLPERADEA